MRTAVVPALCGFVLLISACSSATPASDPAISSTESDIVASTPTPGPTEEPTVEALPAPANDDEWCNEVLAAVLASTWTESDPDPVTSSRVQTGNDAGTGLVCSGKGLMTTAADFSDAAAAQAQYEEYKATELGKVAENTAQVLTFDGYEGTASFIGPTGSPFVGLIEIIDGNRMRSLMLSGADYQEIALDSFLAAFKEIVPTMMSLTLPD